MTTGKTEDTEVTCGRQRREDSSSKASFTTLSSIAIQAGRTQIVASVLQSGSLIHLQLVQFQPGLCEIGSDPEENHILIQEQQQLLEKLQKHEPEVLAVVEKKHQEKLRMRRDGRRKQEEEEELTEVMKASLREGWSLLLRLLERRLDILKQASDFFCRVMEFATGIDRLEDLQIKNEDKLNDVQVSYDFMRKDLLGKSLQVLTSSSILLQRLRHLQRTEALQRRGRVLQGDEEDVEESSQCSQYSRGPVLRLEQLVEDLQDRRRRADQAFRLQLQQAEVVHNMREESKTKNQSLVNHNLQFGSTSDQTKDPELKSGSRSDLQIKSSLEQKPVKQTKESEDLKLESRLQESGPDSWFNLNSKSRLNHLRDLKSGSRLDEIKDERGSRSESRSGGTTETKSEMTRTLQCESSSSESTKLKTESGSQSDSRSEEPGSGSKQENDLKLQSGTEKTNKQQLESKAKETKNPQFSFTTVLKTRFRLDELYICEPDVKPGSRSGEITENRSEKTRNLPSESSLDESSDLQHDLKTEPESQNSRDSRTGFRSEPKNQLKSELLISGPRPVLKTRSRSEEQQHTSGCDGNLESTGSSPEGIRTLGLRCNPENIPESASETAPPKSASIQQHGSGSEKPDSSSVEITDFQTGSRLDLKKQTRSQQGEDLNHLSGSEKARKQNQESKTVETKFRSRSDEPLRCESNAKPGSESEMTKTPEITGSGSDPASVKNRLGEQQQMETQQQQEFRTGYQERMVKTRQDLNCVSELLDSCASMDLGSELQTNRLLEQFRHAEPHFRQLDVEVENTVRSWENLSRVQARLGEAAMEDDLSELLKLQQAVKDKIQQGESILNQSSSFHLTAKQLELLLQSEPLSPLTGSTGLHGSKEEELSRLQEAKQQIQNLLRTTSTMRTDICTAVSQSNWAGFQVDHLEIRLGSLDSLCESWLNKAAQCEEELRREQLTHLLHEDITQLLSADRSDTGHFCSSQPRQKCSSAPKIIPSKTKVAGAAETNHRTPLVLLNEEKNSLRESFKELKKRFSNTKFNYLKRNDRTRNLKAVWNQLQQMEVYQEKLQGLRKRVHGVTARMGSEVKNTGMARQLEDAINELQRQMGQLERNICEHQKTLDMTCKLQQAMEEYHFWCEEASATIARVGKFSLECRSTKAVSILYRQFEKFVWPTVPQQEERISQITELAVRLHGAEEGQRYIEKTVSKHSDMVESIRELSEGLMELEAKLKLENLKQQQQKDEEEKVEEEGERRQGRQTEEQVIKEKSRMKQKDNRNTQEAADMHELKETGHTPELITENDRKEAATNRKPPSEKGQGVNGPTANRELHSEKFTSSFTSTLTICSPVDAKRQVQAALNQSQTAASEPQAPPSQSVISPSFPGNQEEFLREMEGAEQHIGSSFCGSNSLQETSPHVELHQPEVTTEDCFSNDEYDCASPDDISLPPLAETPESNMFQSDVEEGFCFSSHSVHISQVSHQCCAQSEPTRTDSVPQQKESSQMESCPAPTVRLHSRTRFRSEPRSFNPSPFTVPVTTPFTSTLCTILKTKDSTSDLSLDNSVQGYNTKDCSKVKNPPKQRCSSTTLTQDLSQSLHPQSFNSSDKSLHNHNIPKGETEVQNSHPSYTKTNSILPEKRELLESHHCTSHTQQDMKSVKNSRTPPQQDSLAKISISLVSQQNIYIKSSFSGNLCTNPMVYSNSAQESTFTPSSDPVPKFEESFHMSSVTDTVLHKDITQPQDNNLLKPSTTNPQSSTSQDPTFSQSRSEPDQDVPLTLKDSSISTAATVTQSIFNQSLPSGRSQTNKTSNQSPRDPLEDLIQNPPQPKTISNTNICCSKQGLQTVFPLQDTQECVHGSSMNPSSAQPAPPHREPQTNASHDKANLHGTSPYSTPHVLTPSQDPDICRPMAIREEIRLTPQIQGPPLPSARLPQPSSESVPLGKVSEPGLTLFTRPWSQATVMEGCPVMLEVEVMGNPEPRLTRFKLEEDQNQNQEQDLQLLTGSSSADNKWLMLEALDTIMEDWNTWFGTLCVLLWLFYLVLL